MGGIVVGMYHYRRSDTIPSAGGLVVRHELNSCDAATHVLFSLENCFNGKRKVRRIGLYQIAGSAQSKRPLGNLWRGILSDKQDLGIGRNLTNSASRLHTVQCGQPEVKQYEVRLQFLGLPDSLQSI